MKFANVRELKINSNSILKDLAEEDVVITNRGKPVAAVIYMDEDLLDSFVLSHHPALLRSIERDVRRWKRGKLRPYTLEEAKARLLRRRTRRTRRR
ncbi:MAG: type II toxin-antitoxin system prevent-host-death family antitoxin [Planctomycetes bacterium]|nr:type II toxin-antitoxin system prevent-host-death family antitoxin [Planctomycetota bacterium]